MSKPKIFGLCIAEPWLFQLRKQECQFQLPPEINKVWRPKQLQEVPFDSLDHDSCGQPEVFDEVIPEGFLSDSGRSKVEPVLSHSQWDLESPVKYKLCIHQSINYEVRKSVLRLVFILLVCESEVGYCCGTSLIAHIAYLLFFFSVSGNVLHLE